MLPTTVHYAAASNHLKAFKIDSSLPCEDERTLNWPNSLTRRCSGRLAARCNTPDGVRQVVSDDQRAAWIDRHANGSTTCLAVRPDKSGCEVDWGTGWSTTAERYEHDLVSDRDAAIPAAVFTNENALTELTAHCRA